LGFRGCSTPRSGGEIGAARSRRFGASSPQLLQVREEHDHGVYSGELTPGLLHQFARAFPPIAEDVIMKINLEIDCTPEEARTFLGLPDVQPMQEQLLQEMQERMASSIRSMDPQDMMKLWLSPNLKAFEQILEGFARASGAKRE
jgi:hypothetical protein